MHKILNYHTPSDWIVATGKTHTIREMCEFVFDHLGMDYNDYVVQNEKFMRPEELKYLCGDSERTRHLLDWEPRYTFKTMLEEMIEHWQHKLEEIKNVN